MVASATHCPKISVQCVGLQYSEAASCFSIDLYLSSSKSTCQIACSCWITGMQASARCAETVCWKIHSMVAHHSHSSESVAAKSTKNAYFWLGTPKSTGITRGARIRNIEAQAESRWVDHKCWFWAYEWYNKFIMKAFQIAELRGRWTKMTMWDMQFITSSVVIMLWQCTLPLSKIERNFVVVVISKWKISSLKPTLQQRFGDSCINYLVRYRGLHQTFTDGWQPVVQIITHESISTKSSSQNCLMTTWSARSRTKTCTAWPEQISKYLLRHFRLCQNTCVLWVVF